MSAAQQPVAMKLGDVLPGLEARSFMNDGLWIELDDFEHGAAAFVVWRMEGEEHSPECEERARRLVAAFNACAGVPIEVLEGNAAGGLPFSVADQIDQRVLVSKLRAALGHAEDLITNRWGYPNDASSRTSILEEIRAAIDSAKRAGS